jgi:hypothetical protein
MPTVRECWQRSHAKPKASFAVARRALAVVQIGAWPEIPPQDGGLIKASPATRRIRQRFSDSIPANLDANYTGMSLP